MANGDRLVGEVKGLRQGTLQFKTDTMGTVSIKWDRVSALTAPGRFEVETTAGTKFYGTIRSGVSGRLGVEVDGQITELDLASVVKIRPLSQSFWERLDGAISVGANYTKASGIGQGSLNANVTSRRERFEWATKLSTTITIQEQRPRSSRTAYSFTFSRFLQNRWFLPIVGQLDRNTDLGFNLRSSVAGGIGRNLIQSNRSALAAAVSFRVNQEVPVSGETTSNTEAVFGSSYSYFTYDTPKTNLVLSWVLSPSLTVAHRFRMDTDVSLSREIVKDFTAGVTFYDSYDSRPPTQGSLRNDLGFTLTVGWSF
jgi:putative salt-induced outer membrane protein YdiY